MRTESPERQFNRLRDQIQNLVLTAYPNPDRKCCPGSPVVADYARRARDFDDQMEPEADYQHILHCSPCYRDFLDAGEELRASQTKPAKRVPWLVRRRMGRTLDQLEKVMKSVIR